MKFVLLFLFSFNLMAQTTDVRQDKSHACATDFPVYCKDEVPSDTNYWNCLGRKMNLLSPKCTEFMTGIYTRLNACGKDILALCPGTKKNYGNWSKCLAGRKSEVSLKCAKMLSDIETRHSKWDEAYKACSRDKAKHCGSLEPRECMGKIVKLPSADQTPECRAKLATMKSP